MFQTLYMAKEMGKKLGPGALLLRTLPEKPKDVCNGE